MSGIGSLGTATASNIQTGPNINSTAVVDLKVCGTMSGSDEDVKNKLTDVERHDLCVAAPQQCISAYAKVFSFDLFVKMTVDLQPGSDFAELPTALPAGMPNPVSILDMNISRYYQDVGDARNDLEYMLAMKQISLHVMDPTRNDKMRQLQDRLTASSDGVSPTRNYHRHNALFLASTANDFDNDAQCIARNKGEFEDLPNTHIKQFKPHGKGCSSNACIYTDSNSMFPLPATLRNNCIMSSYS